MTWLCCGTDIEDLAKKAGCTVPERCFFCGLSRPLVTTLRPEVRWTTAEHVPVVECNIATPDWVQITVNVMGGHRDSLAAAHRFAKLLNAAGIVLPVAGCSPMNQRACQYKRKDGSWLDTKKQGSK